jgi:hypothetical protein
MARTLYKNTHRLIAAGRGTEKITIDLGKCERIARDWGYSTGPFIKTGERSGEVELWINVASLLRSMGPDAVRSRSKVAKRCNGLVQVRAVNVTEKKVQS